MLALLILGGLGSGCSSTGSSTAQPLKLPAGAPNLDLRNYDVVTIVPFAVVPDKEKDPAVGTKFAADIGARLRNDFGALFKQVRLGASQNAVNELLVTGTVREHAPGSLVGRAILIGVGAASFEAEVVLKDASSQRNLLTAPIDKLWAWGGMMGASKDIDRMMAESAAAVANTIARAKGWEPPGRNAK